MLVKFFKTGGTPKGQIGRSGGGNAARDYLLFEKDENGIKVARKGATLFRGDADMTTETINGLENRTVYSSGVISFSEKENPSDELLNKLIDSYEQTLFPTFNKDQYSSYWVKHEDKGRVELHFIIANVELYSGKVLPVYYDKNDRGLVDSWQNYNNDLYGLDNPKAPENKRSRKITKDFEVKDGYQTKNGKITDEELKGQIYDRIFAYAEFMPSVKSRDDVIKAFEQFDYKVVSKPTDKYISIEHPEQKNNPDKKLRNLRFKDDLCLLNFNRDMLKDMKSYKQQKWERDTPNRLAQSKIDLDRNLEYRIKRMEKKFKNIERKPLDNQLTKDLTQIRATNEPNFLKKVAEYQREELKKIIGQSIEQIYRQHEHDQPEQLTSLKELHQTLIDSIDNQIIDEPLPQFDEVIERYTNAKNHVVTFDHIEYDRHQAELLARQQAQLAEQAQLAQLAQFEQDRQDRLALLASFDQYTLNETGIDELESMDYQALLDLKTEYEEWLQSVDDYAQTSAIDEYIENYQYYRATLNYLHESNLLEKKYIDKLMSELDQTADTATDPELVVNEGSDEEVVQLTPEPTTAPDLDHPKLEKITLNQRQQIVYNIALKYFDENDPEETKNDIAKLDDSELRAFENPYQDEHDEYVKLANSYAKSIQDNLIKKSEIELSKLKALVPERPDHTKMSNRAWDKAFEKWNNDRVLPEANVRNKDIELNNLKNQIVKTNFTHFEKIAKDRPDLATNEASYNEFQQFINEVNRALTEIDRQQAKTEQEVTKNSDIDL